MPPMGKEVPGRGVVCRDSTWSFQGLEDDIFLSPQVGLMLRKQWIFILLTMVYQSSRMFKSWHDDVGSEIPINQIQPVKAVFNRFFQCWNCNIPPISGSPYFDSHQIWMTDHDFRWTSCRSTSNAVAGSIGSGHPVWRDREFVRRGIGGTSFFLGATLGGLDSQGIPTGLGGIFLKGKSGIHMTCLLFVVSTPAVGRYLQLWCN